MEYWIPTKPYSLADALNRAARAQGKPDISPSSSRDINGRRVSVRHNDCNGYWIAEYWYAGRNVIARGALLYVLTVAASHHKESGAGASVHATLRTPDEEATAQSLGYSAWSREIEASHRATFPGAGDWRESHIGEAVRLGTGSALLNAKDEGEYERTVASWLRSGNGPKDTEMPYGW